MSGGIRTSVKGYIIAQRFKVERELNTVHEDETNIDVTGNSTPADSVDHPTPDSNMASTSSGINLCDGKNPCLAMLSSAAKSMTSYGTASGAECPFHTVSMPSIPRTEGEILLSPTLKTFSFNELKRATRNFHLENWLGEGGFGEVFKGWVDGISLRAAKPGTGMVIAVKKLKKESFQGHEEWLAEIKYLGMLQHPNLVKLIGYCAEGDERLLVYEYMPCGSLYNHIFRSCQSLSWTQRMKIALGAAKVLAFLHNKEANVIHRNIKCSNILLDSTYNARLSDFGLAMDGPSSDESHVSTEVMGTYGYAAPEYTATGNLNAKCDVYGFGVVMLEMLSGKKAVDTTRPAGKHLIVGWAKTYRGNKRRVFQMIDNRVEGQYSVAKARIAVDLAFRCLSTDPKLRPNTSDVVETLEQLQESIASTGHALGKG